MIIIFDVKPEGVHVCIGGYTDNNGSVGHHLLLDERIRLNLQDFAAVVMINLGVSLLVALFFVPSLIDKIGLKRRRKSSDRSEEKMENREYPFLRMAAFEDAKGRSISVISTGG